LTPDESDREGPPEPGFARREANSGDEDKRAALSFAGSCNLSKDDHFRKEGAHGGTRGSPMLRVEST
jgi:hypothetical protein